MCPSPSEVSIITVNWNGRAHLESLLPTLQGLEHLEILVVDNGSSDDSVAWVRKNHPHVRLLANPVNEGFAHPCNLAAREATGRYVAFINNDMKADPNWLRSALPHLDERTPCVASRILSWDGTRIDYNGSSLQYLGYAVQQDIGALVQEVTHQDRVLFPCGGAMVIDREVFLETGGFDGDFFAIYEDVDLGWRLWLSGYEIAFTPDSRVYHRGHGTFDSLAPAKIRYLMHRNALLTILKNYEEETFRKVLPLSIILAVKRAILLSGVERESFYLWDQSEGQLERGDGSSHDRVLDSLNHLVAVDDVLDTLPETLKKRRRIQAHRKRNDREIVSLFRDPFRTIVENPEYVTYEQNYLQMLDLSGWFSSDLPREPINGLPDLMQEKVRRLKRELLAWQWVQGHAQGIAPTPQPLGVRKFLNTCRKEGFQTGWKRFVAQVNRGL